MYRNEGYKRENSGGGTGLRSANAEEKAENVLNPFPVRLVTDLSGPPGKDLQGVVRLFFGHNNSNHRPLVRPYIPRHRVTNYRTHLRLHTNLQNCHPVDGVLFLESEKELHIKCLLVI